LARHGPLAFRAQALADGGAFHLGLVEPVHHLGLLSPRVGPSVAVDAEPFLDLLAPTSHFVIEELTHALLVLGRVPLTQALALDSLDVASPATRSVSVGVGGLM